MCPGLWTNLEIFFQENFDALIDGVVYHQDDRLVSDGNRTLKVLNLMCKSCE